MNRDNVLFTVIGLLAGFTAGYLMHEVMAARQPPPRHTQAGGISGAAGVPGQTPGPRQVGPAEPRQAGPRQAGPQQAGPQQAGPQAAMQQVQQLRAYVEANPDDSEALRLLANMNYEISNWTRAAELYERLLGLRPGDIDVMTDLGACYRYLGQFDRALELFREVQKASPSHWQSRYNEILVLAFDLGDLPTAAEATRQLRTLQPDNPDVERLAAEIERRMDST